MTDSSYVHSGLQGNAMRWRANGWVSPQGPVTNVDLWIDLMQVLDVSLAQFCWVKVPSHTDIAGNDRADALASAGRLASPLYATVRVRVTPPPPTLTPLATPLRSNPLDVEPRSGLTGVEVSPLCEADPFTLRALQDPQLSEHEFSARRLFLTDEQPSRSLNEPMSDDSLVLSQVLTTRMSLTL